MAGLFRETLYSMKDKVDLARDCRQKGDLLTWASLMEEVQAEQLVIDDWLAMSRLLDEHADKLEQELAAANDLIDRTR